jgi:hypothetical protein
VSFVGRPFPLSEAPHHFARLQAWGLTLVRLLVTWESLAHDGPNPETDMDNEYIDYLSALIALMPRYGIKVIICAHQDVWSRFSGGSGAPGWTFEKAGLDIEAFKATGAAYVDHLHPKGEPNGAATDSKENDKKPMKKAKAIKRKPEPVGAFVWPSGYQKLAAATMATLFWAGDIFAWKLTIPHYDSKSSSQKVNIKEYLQGSYIECFGKLIDRIGPLEAVIGVDVINEPHRGYVGAYDWNRWNYDTDLHIGFFPSLLQSLALGSGFKQAVPFYVKSWPFPSRQSHKSIVDPLSKSAWLKDSMLGQCVWRAHGAWEWNTEKKEPVILRQDFFTRDPRPGQQSRRIEWYRECYAPFINKFSARMKQNCPDLITFVEPIPNEYFPPWSAHDTVSSLTADKHLELMKASYDQDYSVKTFIDVPRPSAFVYAPHFYDLNVLFGKVYNDMSVNVQGLSRGMFITKALHFGIDGLLNNYIRQIGNIKDNGRLSLGVVPTIIGEVGIPWDINGSKALRDGDYHKHTELLDALITAMEHHQVAFTLWNYNPHNSTSRGDGWNMEDFSIMCDESQSLDIDHKLQDDVLYRGGRGLDAIIRPYAVKVAGYPIKSSWNRDLLQFDFSYVNGPTSILSGNSSNATMQRRTEIYLPKYHFQDYELKIETKDGSYQLDRSNQSLYLDHENTQMGYAHQVRISIIGTPPKKRKTRSWYHLGIQDTFTLCVIIAVLAICLTVADRTLMPYLQDPNRSTSIDCIFCQGAPRKRSTILPIDSM